MPNVSWKQIDAYFAQANISPSLLPEKRKALIEYITANNAIPAEYDALYAKMEGCHGMQSLLEENTFEEYLLVKYIYCRNMSADLLKNRLYDNSWRDRSFFWIVHSPWETVRRDRLLRLELVVLLAEYTGLQDKRVKALGQFSERLRHIPAIFDQLRESMIDANHQERHIF